MKELAPKGGRSSWERNKSENFNHYFLPGESLAIGNFGRLRYCYIKEVMVRCSSMVFHLSGLLGRLFPSTLVWGHMSCVALRMWTGMIHVNSNLP
jgi:hypothetical protein